MVQLADLFSLPEMCLMCQVTDLFIQRNIEFQPAVLFSDVRVGGGGEELVLTQALDVTGGSEVR